MIAFLIQLLLVALVLAVIYWLLAQVVPAPMLRVLQIIIAVILLLWVLSALGVLGTWYPYRPRW